MKKFIYLGTVLCAATMSLSADSYSSAQNGNNNSAQWGNNQQMSSNDSYGTSSDRQILQSIRNQLGMKFSQIFIAVANGVVTLNGTVSDANEANNVANTVSSVQGVQSVNNFLQVRNGGNSSGSMNPNDSYATDMDRQIVMKIRKQWQGKYDTVSINVSQGVVTLEGTVKNRGEFTEAARGISSIQGVTSVNNQLQIANS